MNQEQLPEDSITRLDRLERITEVNSKQIAEMRVAIDSLRETAIQHQQNIAANGQQIAANGQQIAANSADIAELRRVVEANAAASADMRLAVSNLIEIATRHQQNFEVIVSEIRGLRTENSRILDHLFGQQDN